MLRRSLDASDVAFGPSSVDFEQEWCRLSVPITVGCCLGFGKTALVSCLLHSIQELLRRRYASRPADHVASGSSSVTTLAARTPTTRGFALTLTSASFFLALSLVLSETIRSANGGTTVILHDGFNQPALWTTSTTAGFSTTTTSTEVTFRQSTGFGNGKALLTTVSTIHGDFTAEVDGSRSLLSNIAEAGIGVSFPAAGADVFFVGNGGQINANLVTSQSTFRSTMTTASSVRFRISRSGQTLTQSFDDGSGFVTVISGTDSRFAQPAQIELFEEMEYGNTSASQITFGNFTLFAPVGVPSINPTGVVNAASNSSGPVSPGSIVTVYGDFQLTSSETAHSASWPNTLSGFSMQFNGVQAPLYYVSGGQVSLQVPWEMAGKSWASITASINGQTSAPQTVNLVPFAPGIFSTNAQGTGQGAILNSSYRLVDEANPAIAGSTSILIYCTGLGEVDHAPPSGFPAPSSEPLSRTQTTPTVRIGGVPAKVSFSGLAPGFVGVYQVNAKVPAGITAGTSVPVVISIGGVQSNTVTIAVGPLAPGLNPHPSITSLSLAAVPAGSNPLTITVNGSGFTPSSSVTFNGLVHTPSFISSSQLKITLTAPDLVFPGNFPVKVTNTSPGGGTSNTAYFTVIGGAQVGTSFLVGSNPYGIIFDGSNIWVANSGTEGEAGKPNNTLTKLRASDGGLLGTFTVGIVPCNLVFDGTNVWVTNNGSNSVTKMRASDGTALGTFSIMGSFPFGIAFDGMNIWVTSTNVNGTGTAAITKLRAIDGVTIGVFPDLEGDSPSDLAFDGANVWLTNNTGNNVAKIRPSDGSLLGTFSVGVAPRGILFDGANIWVANNGSNNVTKVRASDGKVLGTFPAGSGPWGLAFDGTNIWVADHQGNTVTKLRASDGAVRDVFVVGSSPLYLSFDGFNMWVTNEGSDTVSKLPVIPVGPVSNPQPSITSLAPASVAAGSNQLTMTISGSGFIASSSVTFNGASHPASFVNSSQLNITLTASDLGTAGSFPVVVTNPPPGGGRSNSVNFNVSPVSVPTPPPVPTGLSPGSSVSPGTTVNTLTPTLSWNASPGATGYVVALVNASTGATIFAQNISSTSIICSTLVNGTTYAWSVAAYNSAGRSAIATPLIFTVSLGQSGLTGNWQGVWGSIVVPTAFGKITASFVQTGTSLTGYVQLDSVCFPGGPLSGTITGTHLSAAITISGIELASVSATVDSTGNTITGAYGVLSGACAGDLGIFSLNRSQ